VFVLTGDNRDGLSSIKQCTGALIEKRQWMNARTQSCCLDLGLNAKVIDETPKSYLKAKRMSTVSSLSELNKALVTENQNELLQIVFKYSGENSRCNNIKNLRIRFCFKYSFFKS
jgi:hypothetical protein